MSEITIDELVLLHDQLAALVGQDKEEEARALIGENLSRLPEEVRKEMLARTVFDELINEAREIETIAGIQRQGIEATEVLLALKEELKKRGDASL